MPINLVTGLPRHGKTLWTICTVKERAEKEKREVYTCNIPGITIEGWKEIDHPDKWLELPDSCILIVDELQDFWGKAPNGQKVPTPILELSKHGKRGIDIYMITQEPSLVHGTPIGLAEWHYFVKRSFGTENAMVYKFQRMQNHPEKLTKKAAEVLPFRYPKKAYTWYKSADVHNIKRKIPAKLLAIPVVLAIAGLCIWGAVTMFSGVIDKAKGNSPAAAAARPGQTSPGTNQPAPGQSGQRQIQTAAEYVQSFQPRIDGLPYTAPRYDEVTKPTTAPFPAACVNMGKRCNCYSQQGTKLDTPKELCAQIVADGFFMDWSPPGTTPAAAGGGSGQSSPGQTAPGQTRAPMQGNPGQIAEVQLKPEPVETDKLKPVRDGQILATMRTTRTNY